MTKNQEKTLLRQIVPHVADFAEEAAGFGGVFAGFAVGSAERFVELFHDILLVFIQLHRRFDKDLNKRITARLGIKDCHALVLKTELLPRLRAGGNFDLYPFAVNGGHFQITAERRPRPRNRPAAP